MLKAATCEHIEEIIGLMKQIEENDFVASPPVFFGASISKHLRHIYEFYNCLLSAEESGIVDYDSRQRDLKLEEDKEYAIQKFLELASRIKEDRTHSDLQLVSLYHYGETTFHSNTSFERELIFNVEHLVHHLAIIKQGIITNFQNIELSENFGVARSTLDYRQKQKA